ncbi:hypothetical protein V8Z80_11685 [Orrella sp. JC864]|uniref:hypothetical protein n=1 Tax=Orrella sp. JC864 TaxID=3120298 RepID=UPI0012BBE989
MKPGQPPRPDRRGAGAHALLMSNLGLIVWALGFVVLYAGLSLGCRLPIAHASWLGLPALSVVLTALWLAHAAWLAWLIARAWRRWQAQRKGQADARFASRLTLLLHGSALLALIWTGFPVMVLPACA